jgi:hypothetical protein
MRISFSPVKAVGAILVAFCSLGVTGGAQSLYVMPDGVETRWASPENPRGERGQGGKENGTRKGSPAFPLKSGEARVLAQVSGRSGTVRRIWMTLDDRSPKMLRGLRLDFYWDGASTPAVSSPLGDFFGMPLGEAVAFQSSLFSSPEGRSFNSIVPMPFKTGMRLVVTNDTDTDLGLMFFDVEYTLGDRHGGDMLYFHAYFRRENPTTLQRDYEILPTVQGQGRFLGANISVIANQETYGRRWWGEGEVKMYIDGDRESPTIVGTGTEDYIGAGFALGPFAHLYQGAPIVDNDRMRFGFYRHHVNDPVFFHRDIRVTVQQIGIILPNDLATVLADSRPVYRAGPGLVEVDKTRLAPFQLFERQDDWASCAYFYLSTPTNKLAPLADVAFRSRGL